MLPFLLVTPLQRCFLLTQRRLFLPRKWWSEHHVGQTGAAPPLLCIGLWWLRSRGVTSWYHPHIQGSASLWLQGLRLFSSFQHRFPLFVCSHLLTVSLLTNSRCPWELPGVPFLSSQREESRTNLPFLAHPLPGEEFLPAEWLSLLGRKRCGGSTFKTYWEHTHISVSWGLENRLESNPHRQVARWGPVREPGWSCGLSDHRGRLGVVCTCRCDWGTPAQVEDLAGVGACSLPAQGERRQLARLHRALECSLETSVLPTCRSPLHSYCLHPGIDTCWCLVFAIGWYSPWGPLWWKPWL